MTPEVAKMVLGWEGPDHYKEITSAEITGDSRWSKFYEQVYQDTRDGSFWEISWSRGATEHQDEGAENIEVQQVWPHVVQTTVYKNTPPEN